MKPVLFFYGTLLVGSSNHRIIRPFVSDIRPARIKGAIYHTGYGFPVVDVEADGQVLGEFVTLNDPATAFSVLDRYEGVLDGDFSLYRRIEVDAFMCEAVDNIPVRTQVYAVNPAKLATIPGLERVKSGDWLSFMKQRRSIDEA